MRRLHTAVMSTETLTALKAALDPKAWSEDPDELAPHVRDWRGRYQGASPLLLKPSTTQEVSRILSMCNEAGVAVIPQSGNTGLVGGSTPQGEVVLSLKRMNAIRAIDPDNDSLTCEAGAILESVQSAAKDAGKLFPLSLGAQGSAMIGGLISTNAGGVHVLRYGMMRELVLGLEAVLPDGRSPV
jgi:FAD/FMN-containing dehydrogenase